VNSAARPLWGGLRPWDSRSRAPRCSLAVILAGPYRIRAPARAGGKGPSKRHEIFYLTETTLAAVRIDDFKYRFTDQPGGWLGATEKVDWPILVNLTDTDRTDHRRTGGLAVGHSRRGGDDRAGSQGFGIRDRPVRQARLFCPMMTVRKSTLPSSLPAQLPGLDAGRAPGFSTNSARSCRR
jgi:hypothetical protein